MTGSIKKLTYVASGCLGAAVIPSQLAGASAPATTAPVIKPSAGPSAGLTLSLTAGPPGTVVDTTVQGCKDPILTFIDGAIRDVVRGTISDQPSSEIAQGDLSGIFTIPTDAPVGNGLFTTSCDRATVGAVFAERFVVGQLGGPSSAAASASPTPEAAGSPTDYVGIIAPPNGAGYWIAAADGGVFTKGQIPFYGSEGGQALNAPIVGIASTPDGKGYWEVGADGGVFSFGDAAFHGSLGGVVLNASIVGISSTPDGNGYWLVGSDGGVFTFGDAAYSGSCYSNSGGTCGTPIVGITSDSAAPDHGYWLAGKNGGVFAYGAPFHGSEAGLINDGVAIVSTQDGGGYWVVGGDGGVFAYGDARFAGSLSGQHLNKPIDAITVDEATGGYWLLGQDGGVFSFNAPFYGSRTQPPPVVSTTGVGLYSASQLFTESQWNSVIGQGWAGIDDAEALGSTSAPWTYVINPTTSEPSGSDTGVEQALAANPGYKGFWESYWTVSSPNGDTDSNPQDFYNYGYAAGAYASQVETTLGGSRLPDAMAIDYEGFGKLNTQAEYVQETNGWADGIHSKMPNERIIFYTSGQSIYNSLGLSAIQSAQYQAPVSPIAGNTPIVPPTGNVVGYQGLFGACAGGNASASVQTITSWGPPNPFSLLEFPDGSNDCPP